MPHVLPVRQDSWVNAAGRVGLPPTPTNSAQRPRTANGRSGLLPQSSGRYLLANQRQHSRGRRLASLPRSQPVPCSSRLDGQGLLQVKSYSDALRLRLLTFCHHCPVHQPFFVKQIHTALSSPDFHTYCLFKTHRPAHGETHFSSWKRCPDTYCSRRAHSLRSSTHRPGPVLWVAPLPAKPSSAPPPAHCHCPSEPQLSCPLPGESQLLSSPAGRAQGCLLGPPQLQPDSLLTRFPSLRSNSTCQASQWDCRLSGGHGCAGGATQSSEGTGFETENLGASFHSFLGKFTLLSLSLSVYKMGAKFPRCQGLWED